MKNLILVIILLLFTGCIDPKVHNAAQLNNPEIVGKFNDKTIYRVYMKGGRSLEDTVYIMDDQIYTVRPDNRSVGER